MNDLIAVIDSNLADAEAVMYTDYEATLRYAQVALAHAQQAGDVVRYAQSLRYIGWAHSSLNQFEMSLVHAMEGMMLARDFGMMDVEAYLVNVVAVTFVRCGLVSEAVHLFEYQLSLGERLQDEKIQLFALNDLGITKAVLGDHDAAIELLQRAVPMMPARDERYYMLYNSMAELCHVMGRMDEAVRYAEYVQHNSPFSHHALAARFRLVRMHVARGNLEEARRQIDALSHIPEEIMTLTARLESVPAIVDVLLAEGRYQEAAQTTEDAYQNMIEINLIGVAIEQLNTLKFIYEKMEDSQKLISVYKRLSEDIPQLQQQTNNMRMTVLRMIFAQDKAAMAAELNLSRQKSTVLARLSHEFRTPLAVIHSAAQTIERYSDRLSEEQRQQRLARITDQVQRATLLLDDILQLLDLEDNVDAVLVQEVFSLEDLAESALRQLETYKLTDQSRVRVVLPPKQQRVKAPREAARTILVHLLTNALKFSKEQVLLQLENSQVELVIRVVDRGIGIPLAEQKAIFKPLVRGSNLDEVAGNGIGMTIVARLLEQIQGDVSIESRENAGTTVTVRIPLT